MVEKKKSFSELSPGKKRLFALLGAAGVVIIFAAASEMLFSPASKDKAPKTTFKEMSLPIRYQTAWY